MNLDRLYETDIRARAEQQAAALRGLASRADLDQSCGACELAAGNF
jgi:hypothetical protein